GIESENVNVVKRLFKIQNLNASTIRTVMVADCSRAMTETELETKVAELFVRNRTKPPELNLLPTDSNSKTKYLIFTTGCLTYSPHQIGKAVALTPGLVPASLGLWAPATL
ncbi:PREDICTED: F-box/WD repeat-containing protein 5, partial [Apaloderma vittatum]|uniref:F-box/WD repeat-containing protein 5 n=1 Tax=Apaloderma vittatum TaxID=57397 RepID=UPI00052180E2